MRSQGCIGTLRVTFNYHAKSWLLGVEIFEDDHGRAALVIAILCVTIVVGRL
jgi:hypothetical protein